MSTYLFMIVPQLSGQWISTSLRCLFLSLQLDSTVASYLFFWTCVPMILFASAPHALVAQSALQFDAWALPRVC